MRYIKSLFVAVVLSSVVCAADTVHLQNGGTVRGVIVAETPVAYVLRYKGSGSITLTKSDVSSVERDETAIAAALPSWDVMLKAALGTSWGRWLQQIPATVIDNGVLKDVPYVSYAAADFEMNVYGDPNMPAGIEIGVYRGSSTSDAAKQQCFDFMTSVIHNKSILDALSKVDRRKGEIDADGFSVEITPTTDPDAYGGWWISIYDTKALDLARASQEELAAITVQRNSARPRSSASPSTEPSVLALGDEGWTPDEIARARRSGSGSGSAGGPVYVRGYTRKDGTYVGSYTRSSPGTGNGRSGGGHGGGGHR